MSYLTHINRDNYGELVKNFFGAFSDFYLSASQTDSIVDENYGFIWTYRNDTACTIKYVANDYKSLFKLLKKLPVLEQDLFYILELKLEKDKFCSENIIESIRETGFILTTHYSAYRRELSCQDSNLPLKYDVKILDKNDLIKIYHQTNNYRSLGLDELFFDELSQFLVGENHISFGILEEEAHAAIICYSDNSMPDTVCIKNYFLCPENNNIGDVIKYAVNYFSNKGYQRIFIWLDHQSPDRLFISESLLDNDFYQDDTEILTFTREIV